MALSVALVYKFYLPNYGGVETLMHTIAKELRRRGARVKVLTLRHSTKLSSREVIDGIEVYRVGFRWLLSSQVDVGINKDDTKRLLSKVDVVHIFSSIPSHLLVSSLRICKELGKACVWQPIFIPNRFKHHRSCIIKALGDVWDKYVLPRLTKYPQALIALTSAEARFFQDSSGSLLIKVLGECVEETNIDPRLAEQVLAKYGLQRDGYILSVGRIAWYKGYDLLVKAWRTVEEEHRNIKLVIVGRDWGYKHVVLDMMHKYRLQNIVLFEDVPAEELQALYEGCIAVVQLSRFETFHRVALEAWSHKKPIIALDLGPATEHIGEGGGILVHDKVGEVVSALRIITEDRDLRLRMGLRGYQIFRARYTVPRYVDNLIELYRKVQEAVS